MSTRLIGKILLKEDILGEICLCRMSMQVSLVKNVITMVRGLLSGT